MIKIENKEQLEKYKSEGKLLVDFAAPWCAPCKMMEPILNEVETESSGCIFVKVDISEHEDIAKEHGIRGVPTLMLFEDGELIATKVGSLTKPAIIEFLQ